MFQEIQFIITLTYNLLLQILGKILEFNKVQYEDNNCNQLLNQFKPKIIILLEQFRFLQLKFTDKTSSNHKSQEKQYNYNIMMGKQEQQIKT